MADFTIHTINELDKLAKTFAAALDDLPYPALLLKGDLGCGKTTFVRFFVGHLNKGSECEVASPSFNICNIYPSEPQIAHFDLYRCGSNIPEELPEALEKRELLTIVEWSGYIPDDLLPDHWLDINFKLDNNTRLLKINANGYAGIRMLKKITDIQSPGQSLLHADLEAVFTASNAGLYNPARRGKRRE